MGLLTEWNPERGWLGMTDNESRLGCQFELLVGLTDGNIQQALRK